MKLSFERVKWPLAALAAGILTAQGLAPVNSALAAAAGLLAIACVFLQSSTVRQASLVGWFYGVGYFACGLAWIVEPFQVDAAQTGWMAPFALIGMAGGLALFWGAGFALGQFAGRGAMRIVTLIGAWGLFELARAYVLTGFPWAGLGQLALNKGGLVLLPWIGAQGLGLWWMASILPLSLVLRRQWVGILALLPLGVICFIGQRLPPVVEMTEHKVRIVQPNAPQDEKWDQQKRWIFFDRLLNYTAAEGDVDLVVWPETSAPGLLNYLHDPMLQMLDAAKGTPVLFGVQREERGEYFNSAVVLKDSVTDLDIYDKMHLVPFGEYMPLATLMSKIGVFGLAARTQSGFAAGGEQGLLDLPIGMALPLICYEGVFAQDVARSAQRPEVMILITNDAWFGTRSGPQQHLVQAQLRAAEQGLPMVRAANTGISAMIDPFGRIVEQIPQQQAGFVDAILPAALPKTVYSQTGDWPALVLATLCVLAGFVVRDHSRST